MTNNVNENEQPIFDEGTNRRNENQESTQERVNFDEKNYLNTRLSGKESKRTTNVRIVLTKDNDGKYKVAIPVEVHSLKLNENQNKEFKISKNGYKSFICLNDPHLDVDSDGCPLCKKVNDLFEDANKVKKTDPAQHKAICKQAYSYQTKTTYIARVIERGHEDEGIKFWRFNKHDDGTGIFDMLRQFYDTYKSAGENIFDYTNGRDIQITLTKKVDTDKNGNKKEKTGIMLMVDVKQSPLSTDEEQIDSWVNDEKDWRDMYRSKSPEYLELIANDQTPVYDKAQKKFVPYVPKGKNNEAVSQEEKKKLQEQAQIEDKPDADLPF